MLRIGLSLMFLVLVGCSVNRPMMTDQPTSEDLPIELNAKIVGFTSSLSENQGTSKYWKKPCEITVPKPKHIEDTKAFCAIGHEIWHCLAGDFHGKHKTYC